MLDGAGREVLRRDVDPFEGTSTAGYGGPRVAAATTAYGLVVATSVEREGGALRSLQCAAPIGEDGSLLARPFVEEKEEAPSEVDVAGSGDLALVHLDTARNRSEALLFGCR